MTLLIHLMSLCGVSEKVLVEGEGLDAAGVGTLKLLRPMPAL